MIGQELVSARTCGFDSRLAHGDAQAAWLDRPSRARRSLPWRGRLAGLWRVAANDVGVTPSRVRISLSPHDQGGNLLRFRKSSFSAANGGCVEVASGENVLVRDTKQEHLGDGRTVLWFSRHAWAGFTGRVRAGKVPVNGGFA